MYRSDSALRGRKKRKKKPTKKPTHVKSKSPTILCLESIIHLTDSEILGDLYFTLITQLNGSGIRQAGWGRRDGEERGEKEKVGSKLHSKQNPNVSLFEVQ